MSEVEKEPQVPDNNDIGEEEVGEEQNIVAPPTDEKVSTGAYKPLQFEVKDIKKTVPDIPKPESEDDKKQAAAATLFSKEDAKFFSEIVWNIPESVWGEYMAANPKAVTNFGLQLFSYCEKKGINPYDYIFEELGLVMAAGVIVTDLASKYRKHQKELREAEKEEKENGSYN